MKVRALAKILAVTGKEGKNGKYNKVVLMVDDEIIDAFSKSNEIKESADRIEVVMELKKYKGNYSSVQVLGLVK